MNITVEPNINKGETRLSMYRVTVLDNQSNLTTCFIPMCYLAEQYVSVMGNPIIEYPLDWEDPEAVRSWLSNDIFGTKYLEEILPIFAWNGDPEEFEMRLQRIERSLDEVDKWEGSQW